MQAASPGRLFQPDSDRLATGRVVISGNRIMCVIVWGTLVDAEHLETKLANRGAWQGQTPRFRVYS